MGGRGREREKRGKNGKEEVGKRGKKEENKKALNRAILTML